MKLKLKQRHAWLQENINSVSVYASESQFGRKYLKVVKWEPCKSFDSIAKELGVSKQTLLNWSESYNTDLQNIRAAKFENLLKDLKLSRFERVKFYADLYNKLRDELKTRDLSKLPTTKIFSLLSGLEHEVAVGEEYRSEIGVIFDECKSLIVD